MGKGTKSYISYRLEVPTEVWLKFKDTLKKTEVINTIIIEFIEKETKRRNNE